MFTRVLIANRGEIAVRIARTLQQMGIRAVGVYSEADRTALHVEACDEAWPLAGASAAETYLRGEALVRLARERGCEAVHPGYGFLAENAHFAELCREAGLAFIGPAPEVIRAMADKPTARRRMEEAGVPVIPGAPADPEGARRLGYPVLVKAAAGGGGKGMRRVDRESDLAAALEACAREARGAFGDDRLYLEKYLVRPRHVEIQIFGDEHGHRVHLFERECSVQRRHQKVVEEAPCEALEPPLRRAMAEAALRAAEALGYTNAGTVEFLLDPEEGEFYFLEVNTRLQVEHPVTEEILRRDLVRAQVLVAAGLPLPFTQEDLTPVGHAFECRIYAEDPARGFLPGTGTVLRYLPPEGPGVRVDSGVREGSAVTVHYDPLLSKLITWGEDRCAALDRMRWALERFAVLGVVTNLEWLRQVVDHPEFRAGRLHTRFVEEHGWESQPAIAREAFLAALVGEGEPVTEAPSADPWALLGSWRLGP